MIEQLKEKYLTRTSWPELDGYEISLSSYEAVFLEHDVEVLLSGNLDKLWQLSEEFIGEHGSWIFPYIIGVAIEFCELGKRDKDTIGRNLSMIRSTVDLVTPYPFRTVEEVLSRIGELKVSECAFIANYFFHELPDELDNEVEEEFREFWKRFVE